MGRAAGASPGERALLNSDARQGERTHILDAFAARVRARPEAPAGRYEERVHSYLELDQLSSRLAQALIEAGVGPEVPVAVWAEPCLEVLLAIVAIFKAGGVYLPLDPTHPPALRETMCREAGPRVLLTVLALREGGPALPTFVLDDPTATWRSASVAAVAIDRTQALRSTAYLFYTSGTTGIPKAIRASHANLAFYLDAARAAYRFTSEDVFCSLARYTFSISLFELLLPLYCGASVRLDGRERVRDYGRLAELLAEVTVVHAGPSLLASFFRWLREQPSERRFSNLRHASSGGDLVGPQVMEQLKQTFDRAEVYVIYGCTEISCMGCTYAVARDRRQERSVVGVPFPGMRVALLDEQRSAVAHGEVGEIAFSGPGVVSGYLARPELNAQRFVELDGETFYLTGDVGRFRDGDGLEMLGRRDFQVQVRGMRVEVAGIEQTVIREQLAAQCVVVAKRFDDDDDRLAAFVVQPRAAAAAIRARLAELLPDYMVPQRVAALPSLPVTVNGKVDRRALQHMAWEAPSDGEDTCATQDPVEQQIAEVFARGLRIAPSAVAPEADFFQLGGHSLLAVTVTREIEQVLAMPLPPGILFERGSVRALARFARGEERSGPRAIRLSTQRAGRRLFMIAGVHVYRELAGCLEGECEVYGVFTGCELTLLSSADDTYYIPELAAEYIALIRQEQPHGPYYLGGTSFGGIVVYEVAQQLLREGEQVHFLGLIDAILPEHTLGSWMTRLRRLAPLPLRELVPLVYDRMKVKLLRALGRRRAPEFAQYEDDERFHLMEIMRADFQGRSAVRYMSEIRPYHEVLTLIIAGARLRANPHKADDCGFRRWATKLDLHVVDALHLALLERPKVQEVAAIFARAFAAAEPAL